MGIEFEAETPEIAAELRAGLEESLRFEFRDYEESDREQRVTDSLEGTPLRIEYLKPDGSDLLQPKVFGAMANYWLSNGRHLHQTPTTTMAVNLIRLSIAHRGLTTELMRLGDETAFISVNGKPVATLLTTHRHDEGEVFLATIPPEVHNDATYTVTIDDAREALAVLRCRYLALYSQRDGRFEMRILDFPTEAVAQAEIEPRFNSVALWRINRALCPEVGSFLGPARERFIDDWDECADSIGETLSFEHRS